MIPARTRKMSLCPIPKETDCSYTSVTDCIVIEEISANENYLWLYFSDLEKMTGIVHFLHIFFV